MKFGSSYRAPPHGGNNDWASKKSIAKYQFALIADQTSTRPRDIKRDFLQVLTIEGSIHKLADPPLVSSIFTILPGVNYSSHQSIGMIETPDSQISYEAGIRKNLTLVPVQIVDNILPTGVDTTSRTASSGDIGYQANNWIMAPAGNVPATSQECNNAMKFQIPLPKGVRLKISCPGATPSPAIISPQVGNEPTVVWHGTANATSEQTPIFEVGTEESVVDLPIRVKVMKNRTVKVQVHLVNLLKSNGDVRELDDSMLPSEEDLEQYLYKIFATQLNAWFDVTVDKNPHGTLTHHQADPRTDGDTTFNLDDNEAISTDQQKVLNAVGSPPTNDIRVFIIANEGTFLVQNQELAYGFTNRSAKTCWVLGRSSGDYSSQESLKSSIAHEIGHVLTGYGHPDTGSQPGSAPLVGTDRSLRIMCSHSNRSKENGKFLVKKEWDEAEAWLSIRPNGDN